jgi:hypothetical protein
MADHHEWEDEEEEEEEDEDDFIPDADDDDDDAYDVEDEGDDDDGSFPTFLQGELFVDKSKGLCYEEEGVFCLVCQTSLDEPFNFQSPPVDKPLVFAGWVKNPSQWFEFNLTFAKEAEPTDELELKLLKTQEEKQGMNGGNSKDDSPVKGNLKAPPAYSVGDAEEGKKGPAKANLKSPPLYSTTTTEGTVFVISATHQGDGGGEEKGRRISFRGMYRPPPTFISRLYLISSVQIEENPTASSNGNNNGAQKAAPVVAAAAAAAAAPARKRGRSNRDDDDDDDSVEGGGGVEYQELIDLHDDAGLSTEELRRRYCGGGRRDDDDDAKKPSSTDGSSKRMKGSSAAVAKKNEEDDDDDDDDDDAYGF